MLSSRVAVFALFVMLSACNAASGPVTVANTSEPMTYRSLAASSASIDATAARDMISLYQPNNGPRDPALDKGLQSVAEMQAGDMAQRGEPSARLAGASAGARMIQGTPDHPVGA
ncbi:hypothetical protein [Methylocystis silviterrae]|uniref:hypothetical protein n=1 Tax=Methylocystis silviterrae TaxID=2743612 RepID=UPI003C71167F